MTPATLSQIAAFWASWLGCRPEDLDPPGVHLVSCHESIPYRQVFLLQHGTACLVSIRGAAGLAGFASDMAEVIKDRAIDEIFDAQFWERSLGHDARTVGPAYVGYTDKTTFQPHTLPAVRLLTKSDETALQQFADACSRIEWEHSTIRFDRSPLYGCFIGDVLTAVATYNVWAMRIAHIGVVSHPAYRGCGYGKAVVSAVAEQALSHNLIPQYRTLMSNTSSVALADKLGFEQYAETISVIVPQW